MNANDFQLDAEMRPDLGKGASRRLRRNNKVPAVIYGGNQAPTAIMLEHNKLIKALEQEAIYSHILNININKKKHQVVLKELQRHPYKQSVLHVDFQRVKGSDIVVRKVPLHFLAEDSCPGVKQGGIVNHLMIDLEIRCKVSQLPEYIEVDLSKLPLDHAIHLSEIELPSGVEIPAIAQKQDKEHDLPVVSVHRPRQAKVVEEEAVATEETDDDKEAAEKEKDK